ncbi:MAG: RnfABCDGE type electron transport complex subunit D, partial [Clostridia bacterium]|nr:RnfABCDGE type electron transport complex subunit D [Clostridia bacterium]
MADKIYAFSSSPHVKTPLTTRRIMIDVCIALLPALVMGIVFFGFYALLLVVLAVAAAVLSEFLFDLIVGKKPAEFAKSFDFSSCVTGLLIGVSLGTNYPWYAPVLGSMFAIIPVKMLFGGTGKNVVNPAVAGRIFIFISFQAVVTSWLMPYVMPIASPIPPTTGATVLENLIKTGNMDLSNWDLLLGTGVRGCLGETCKVALIVGGIYLSVRRIINPFYPVIYIATEGLFAVILGGFNFSLFLPSILSGGLMLGAIFMATDYTTTPNTTIGNVIYFIFLGLLTAGLRAATKMEVVS